MRDAIALIPGAGGQGWLWHRRRGGPARPRVRRLRDGPARGRRVLRPACVRGHRRRGDRRPDRRHARRAVDGRVHRSPRLAAGSHPRRRVRQRDDPAARRDRRRLVGARGIARGAAEGGPRARLHHRVRRGRLLHARRPARPRRVHEGEPVPGDATPSSATRAPSTRGRPTSPSSPAATTGSSRSSCSSGSRASAWVASPWWSPAATSRRSATRPSWPTRSRQPSERRGSARNVRVIEVGNTREPHGPDLARPHPHAAHPL